MINRLIKISIITICVIFININLNTIVYAENAISGSTSAHSDNHDVYHQIKEEKASGTSTDSESWVSDAFSAASSFFSEDVNDEMGIIEKPLDLFSNLVKAINKVLTVALAGISAISLSIVGIRYITSIADPNQKNKAKKDLHTTFRGMVYGFGAFFIWQIAMSIVRLIIKGFASS